MTSKQYVKKINYYCLVCRKKTHKKKKKRNIIKKNSITKIIM